MMRLTASTFLASVLASAAFAQPAVHVPPYPRVENTIGYKVDPAWPLEKPPGGDWNSAMSSVALGADGNVWTFNRGKIPVQVYSQDGKLVKYWGGDGVFKNPHSIRFDSAGNLWIVDTGTSTVRRFSLDGKVLQTIGTPNEPGNDQTHMNQPNDVAVAANGDLYISDGYGNDRVVVFDKNGKYLRSWGKLGQSPGEFSQPHSIVLDSKGRVYGRKEGGPSVAGLRTPGVDSLYFRPSIFHRESNPPGEVGRDSNRVGEGDEGGAR